MLEAGVVKRHSKIQKDPDNIRIAVQNARETRNEQRLLGRSTPEEFTVQSNATSQVVARNQTMFLRDSHAITLSREFYALFLREYILCGGYRISPAAEKYDSEQWHLPTHWPQGLRVPAGQGRYAMRLLVIEDLFDHDRLDLTPAVDGAQVGHESRDTTVARLQRTEQNGLESRANTEKFLYIYPDIEVLLFKNSKDLLEIVVDQLREHSPELAVSIQSVLAA